MKALGKLLTLSITIILATLFSVCDTFAAGGAGTGNPSPSGGGGGTHLGSQAGGGWFWYSWPEGNTTGVVIGGQGNYKGGTIGPECAEVGGYYVSQWYWFHGDGFTDYRGMLGIAENQIWRGNWSGIAGNTNYGNPSSPDDVRRVPMDTVRDDYRLAQAAGVTGDTADATVGWFCFSPDLREKKGEVHAKSTITATTDGAAYSEESDEDGFVGIKISTKSGTVNVTFGQTFSFKNEDGYDFTTDNPSKTFNEAYTYIGTKKNGESAVNASRTWDATANSNSLTWSPTEDKNTITVNLDEGEVTQPICRKAANYATKLNFKGDEVEYNDPKKTTEACIIIERPKTPGPDNVSSSPSISGNNSTHTMYIGEGSSIGWNTKVDNKVKKIKPSNNGGTIKAETRRLKRYKVISYLVDPDLTRNVDDTSMAVAENANYSSNNNLCDYIKGQLGTGNVRSCGVVNGEDNDTAKERDKTWGDATSDNFSYSHTQGVVVPENYGSASSIGAKYCTTMGYKFQYWYGVNKTGGSNWSRNITWHPDSKKDAYWHIFPSACSVIAKRPSMAVWNGSVFADAGAKTSLSKRYSNSEGKTPMGTLTNGAGVEISNTYGSWGEYLLIGGTGTIDNMASAAALTNGKSGNQSVKNGLNKNSNLTIQNVTSPLGKSNINPNGTYRTRLDSKLRDAEGVAQTASNASQLNLNTSNSSGSIYKVDGNLNIDRDIINSGVYAPGSIPQMVIFVSDNVTITEDVKRIDAWLIVNGNLNTCSNLSDADSCSNQLIFNGPVSAGSITLNRTHGAEKRNEASEPAEVFNFRPDAYIWAYNQSVKPDDSGGYEYKIVDSKELAPRY